MPFKRMIRRLLCACLVLSLAISLCSCMADGKEDILPSTSGSVVTDPPESVTDESVTTAEVITSEETTVTTTEDVTTTEEVTTTEATTTEATTTEATTTTKATTTTVTTTTAATTTTTAAPEPEVPKAGIYTVKGSFSCDFENNDWDSYCVDVTGDVEHCWGTTFPDITSLVTSVCPIENVYYLEVELKASNMKACKKGVDPRCELHWNSRADTTADSQGFTGDTIYLCAFPNEDVSKIILNPYAFNAEVGVINFEVIVKVTVGEPRPDEDDPNSTSLNNKPTGEPKMTEFTISDKLTPSIDLGFTVKKLTNIYKPANENNPISSNVFFADPTSVEYNGRLYVYGTNDSQEYAKTGGKTPNTYGGINSLVCYSTADMVNWTYHGEIHVTKIATWAGCSWAPSIVSKEVNGKTKFFLYFCNSGGGVGVLTADSPIGPWNDPIGKALVHNGMLGDDPVCWCFDPGVVIDDNGTGWLAFGGGHEMHGDETPKYTGNCRLVKLGDDMVSLASEIVKIPALYHFEANELNFIGGKYLLTYCSNYAERKDWDNSLGKAPKTCSMCYIVCEGDPLNPDNWVWGGEYLTNPNTYGYPFSNNHTHLQKFGDKYYILYQSVSLLENMGLDVSGGYRSIGVDEITVDEKTATISFGRMTDKGVSQVAYMNAFAKMKAEAHHSAAGISYENDPSRGYVVTDIDEGDYILIKGVSFGNGADSFAALVKGKGIVEVRLDSADGKAVGAVQFNTSDYEAVWTKLDETVSGVHDVYLVFGGDFKFDTWQFAYLG